MFTRPPELTDAQLVASLAARWGVDADSLEYVALGFGSHHWNVDARGGRWFLTVDDLDAKLRSITETRDDAFARLHAALLTARSLRDAGMAFVVAPTPTNDGAIVARIDDRFVVALYPHVDGRTHSWGEFTSRADRLAVLAMVIDMHDASPSAHPSARTDDFELSNRDDLDLAFDELGRRWDSGPFAERARTMLNANARDIERMSQLYDRLAEQARQRPDRMVVTHGEPHIGNTILAADGWKLVDWDTALLAPPERDLWTVAKGDDTVVDDYVARTARPVLPSVLDLYRLAWDVAEIAFYTALFRRAHVDSADIRESYKNLANSIDAGRRQTGSTDKT